MNVYASNRSKIYCQLLECNNISRSFISQYTNELVYTLFCKRCNSIRSKIFNEAIIPNDAHTQVEESVILHITLKNINFTME